MRTITVTDHGMKQATDLLADILDTSPNSARSYILQVLCVLKAAEHSVVVSASISKNDATGVTIS